MTNQLRLTNANIKKIVPPASGRVTYHDTKLKGLQLRVSSAGTKSFCVRVDLGGKTKRVTLGNFPNLSADDAEREAMKHLSAIAKGVDPNARKKADIARLVTLRECLNEYIKSRTALKESTAKDYRSSLENYLSDWLDKPLLNITRDNVERKHKEIGEKSPSRANKIMRVLRAIFEYAHGKYEDENGEPLILHNPVKRLSQAKAWFKESRRSTYIKAADIKPWYEAVNSAPEWLASRDAEGMRDYLLLVLFTGLRRREASSLTWDEVDLQDEIITIVDTKNGHPHLLPLPSFMLDLLKRRYAVTKGQPYVFPSSSGKGCLAEPKKGIVKVRDKSGVYFTLHDLRRTFITTAESLGIRDYTLKRLLNHRSGGDVTDGYIITDVERLREPMQKIEDRLLLLATKPSNVTPLSMASKSA